MGLEVPAGHLHRFREFSRNRCTNGIESVGSTYVPVLPEEIIYGMVAYFYGHGHQSSTHSSNSEYKIFQLGWGVLTEIWYDDQ